MRGVFLFLMGEKGLKVLEFLTNVADHKKYIVRVIGARDKAVVADYYDEIKQLSESHGLSFVERKEFRPVPGEADYAISVSWRWMITSDEFRLIVLHDSLLPKYRGFNPLVTALIQGDPEIGVTAVFADREFDSGDIVGQISREISYPVKIKHAIEVISELSQLLVGQVMTRITTGSLTRTPQNEKAATYSIWRDEQDYRIDWSKSSQTIKRHVDAVGYPYQGACAFYGEKKIRILEVDIREDLDIVNREPGKILSIHDNLPTVICGEGLIRIILATDWDSGEAIVFSRLRKRMT